jgi:hypothetical protein
MTNSLISKDIFYRFTNQFLFPDVEENIITIADSGNLGNLPSDVKSIVYDRYNLVTDKLSVPPEHVSTIVLVPYYTISFSKAESETFSKFLATSFFARLSPQVSKLSIRSFRLDYQLLAKIPESVTVLDLHNSIDFFAKYDQNVNVTIPANLEALGLSRCFILSIESTDYPIMSTKSIVHFLSSLHNANRLSKLDLSANELEKHDDEEFARIMDAIPTSVTHLRLAENQLLKTPNRLAKIPHHIQFLDLSAEDYELDLPFNTLKEILDSLPKNLTVKFTKKVEINLAEKCYLFEDIFEKIEKLKAYGEKLKLQDHRKQAGLDAIHLSEELKNKFEELTVKSFFKQDITQVKTDLKALFHQSRATLGEQRRWEDYILPIFLICIGVGLFILPINKLMTGQFFLNSTHRQNQLDDIEQKACGHRQLI